MPRAVETHQIVGRSTDRQAGYHSRFAAPQSLLRWTLSSTFDTHDDGTKWCCPSGLLSLVSLIRSPSTWSTTPSLVPHEPMTSIRSRIEFLDCPPASTLAFRLSAISVSF